MSSAILVVMLLMLLIGGVSVYSSVRIVEEGDLEAVIVFGKMEGVLEPGLNIVPPLVSKTYPIDPGTMTMDRGDTRVEIPAAFEDEVRDAANIDVRGQPAE